MKQWKHVFILFLLVFSFSVVTPSAVIICDVKAKILSIPDQPLKPVRIHIISAKFSQGHSAGNICPVTKDQEMEIILENHNRLKVNQIASLLYRRVYGFNSEKKHVMFESWEYQ